MTDIVAAHLFGLFRSLRLRENALAIALSVQMRREVRDRHLVTARDLVSRSSDDAEHELRERSRRESGSDAAEIISLDTDFGTIEIDIAEPIITLARRLRQAETSESAAEVVEKADFLLDGWESSRREREPDARNVTLPFGVELRLPPEFGRQR